MRFRPLVALSAVLSIWATLGGGEASAWSPLTQISIAEQAASISPPDLARQIEKHELGFREGAVAPFRGTSALDHSANEDGSGHLSAVIEREVGRAIEMIVEHRPFAEIVPQLGVVSHYVADASNPLNTSAADPAEGRYFADFLGYAESARDRFHVTFYGIESAPEGDFRLGAMVERSLQRSRQLYPRVGAEYERIPAIDGKRYFDDRSTAFATAALAYSRAVSDVAVVLRYIWLQAGGGDERDWLPIRAETDP